MAFARQQSGRRVEPDPASAGNIDFGPGMEIGEIDSRADRLRALGEERMPAGERCPLELLPAAECAPQLRSLLAELRLDDAGHVEVYSLVA